MTDEFVTRREFEMLRQLLDERHSSADRAVAAALSSAERAVAKAEVAAERRFESVNEFRGQLSDMVNTLIPRHEAENRLNSFEERLNRVQSTVDKGFSASEAAGEQGRWQRSDSRASYAGYYALAGVGLTILIIIIAVMNLVTKGG